MLDTHAFLWFVLDDPRLSIAAMAAIESRDNTVFVSPVSHWEIAIKISLGRYVIKHDFVAFWETAMSASRFQFLPITLQHSALLASMPFHHKDPFDRLLVAQSTVEGAALLSRDRAFDPYGVTRVW